ncbi:hypothetical protein [Promicromonospora soli]
MDTPRPNTLTRTCGSLTITVRYDGAARTGPFGLRHRWTYRLEDAARPDRTPAEGVDLYPVRQSPANAREALGSLLALLTIAGRGHADQRKNPGSTSASLVRFAAWVPEASHLNANELAALALELASAEHSSERAAVPARNAISADQPPSTDEAPWPPGRWYGVVFLQDEEGYDVVDLIDAQGPNAAIEHLSAWDYGSETRDTALFHDHTHTTLTTEPGGHCVESGPYALVWHTGLGHVSLLRQFEPDHEPPIWWLNRAGLLTPETPASTDGARPIGTASGKTSGPSL